MSFIDSILNFFNPKKTKEEIDKEAKRQLEEWKVDMYAKNTYLVVIPQEAINRQYTIIYKKLLDENT